MSLTEGTADDDDGDDDDDDVLKPKMSSSPLASPSAGRLCERSN